MGFSVLKTIDKLGRIVIPKELRKYYGLSFYDEVELIPTPSGILLTKAGNNKNANSEGLITEQSSDR